MRLKRRNNLASGFTLLELIMAMLMVAMLSASLYKSLSTAYTAKKSAERAIKPIRAVSLAADIITRDFDSIVMPDLATTSDVAPGVGPYFLKGSFFGQHQGSGSGSADTVEFCTNGSDGGTDDVPFSIGVRRVHYTLRADLTPPVLVRRVTRNLLSPTLDQVEPEEEVICRNVQSFSMTYFDGLEQYEDWDSTTQLQAAGGTNADAPAIPLMVKMEIIVNIDEDGTSQTSSSQQPRAYRVTRTILLPVAKS